MSCTLMYCANSRRGAAGGVLTLLGAIAGCAAALVPLSEFRGSLASNEELVVLETRQNVTARVLLTKPASVPKGIVLHFPGGEGFLVNVNGDLYGAFRRELAAGGLCGCGP